MCRFGGGGLGHVEFAKKLFSFVDTCLQCEFVQVFGPSLTELGYTLQSPPVILKRPKIKNLGANKSFFVNNGQKISGPLTTVKGSKTFLGQSWAGGIFSPLN